jgi:hypothetical protein
MNNKTTKKDFQIFCRECSFWITYFGLYEFEWHYAHIESKEPWRAKAVELSDTGKMVSCDLNINWGVDVPSHRNICKSAFHEVMEVLMLGIRDNMVRPEWYIHTHIRTMENTIFRDSYQSRFKQ